MGPRQADVKNVEQKEIEVKEAQNKIEKAVSCTTVSFVGPPDWSSRPRSWAKRASRSLLLRPARMAVAGMAYLAWVGSLLYARVNTEDAALREEFGEKWEEWAKRTPYKLVPWVY